MEEARLVMKRVNDVTRISHACGRKLLRVGASGDDLIEFVFERAEGESAELLVTLPVWGLVQVGEIDLSAVEDAFGRQYGLGVA
jgi:hypothetical protein